MCGVLLEPSNRIAHRLRACQTWVCCIEGLKGSGGPRLAGFSVPFGGVGCQPDLPSAARRFLRSLRQSVITTGTADAAMMESDVYRLMPNACRSTDCKANGDMRRAGTHSGSPRNRHREIEDLALHVAMGSEGAAAPADLLMAFPRAASYSCSRGWVRGHRWFAVIAGQCRSRNARDRQPVTPLWVPLKLWATRYWQSEVSILRLRTGRRKDFPRILLAARRPSLAPAFPCETQEYDGDSCSAASCGGVEHNGYDGGGGGCGDARGTSWRGVAVRHAARVRCQLLPGSAIVIMLVGERIAGFPAEIGVAVGEMG